MAKKTAKKATRKTADALKIIDKMIGKDRQQRKLIEEATLNCRVAQLIYDARTAAELTQAELAELIGTSQPTIARLEDADYEGHSLSMVQRIAAALHRPLEISFGPPQKKMQTTR
jgi:ribosome-binding protein aMBF1 (putative translation factor)